MDSKKRLNANDQKTKEQPGDLSLKIKRMRTTIATGVGTGTGCCQAMSGYISLGTYYNTFGC